MSDEPRALPSFDDLDGQVEHSLRIPPLLQPLSVGAAPRPTPLEPSTPINNGPIPSTKLEIPGESKSDSISSGSNPVKDAPADGNPIVLKDGPRKRQKLDFFQLPKPKTSSKVTSNTSPFAKLPLLSGLRQPPPSAALFPPITPEKSHSQHFDFGPLTTLTGTQTDSTIEAEESISALPTVNRSKLQHFRGRKAWTEQETGDLLKGVELCGVGKWKSILNHSDLRFHTERSAVDLKDRYRTYKTAKTRSKRHESAPKEQVIATRTQALNGKTRPSEDFFSDWSDPSNTGFHISTVSDVREQLANPTRAGATQANPQRFARWSKQEDSYLVQAHHKHGFKWTTMAQDPELGLIHRTAGQIRDRFRIKFAQNYESSTPLPAPEASAGIQSSSGELKRAKDNQKSKTRGNLDWLLHDDSMEEINNSFARLSKDFSHDFPSDVAVSTAPAASTTGTASRYTTEHAFSADTNMDVVANNGLLTDMEASIEADETRNPNIEELLNDDVEPLSQLPPLRFPFDQDWSGDAYDDSLTLAPLLLWGGYDFATGQWVGGMNG